MSEETTVVEEKAVNLSKESKAIMDAKLKIADITQHTLVKSEKIMHKENSKGVSTPQNFMFCLFL